MSERASEPFDTAASANAADKRQRGGGARNGVRLVRGAELSDVAEYAYAAVVEAPARFVFAAGACPLDENGATVAVGDYAGQARQVMANLRTALREAGAELTDVVKTTVFVVSAKQDDLVAAWEVVRDAFGDHDPPSTLLGVAALGYDDQLVEVEAIAVTRSQPRLSEGTW
ncbi:Enamine deaminase RidA, house cleaning of reactive enamine intermediates, YjgF/YER057c/UK114 family [Amycolatopsis arida]|uniref:Enamine deaminase RidA, house cleaning of reactive enamine intermediates, YjgF/YER057c/UK114 family n=1 Tax=Amycolatopsis arida TaxID=587909 RepID=A0A1I5TA14_9PSEU|nr:RidA family protein [Amycolatopsis arida]TDX96164.1 enamine deaminase RidA (YjgF/YER057c/UK114 family) [Amycolatopsis arida]SFP79889.1 Enamine deaminase RidA, house cleaning of reactive enamine intermediates, YjgF/YER057c/UK114 family [Amycolatopsis arida]